jgi:hypothetical protein
MKPFGPSIDTNCKFGGIDKKLFRMAVLQKKKKEGINPETTLVDSEDTRKTSRRHTGLVGGGL